LLDWLKKAEIVSNGFSPVADIYVVCCCSRFFRIASAKTNEFEKFARAKI